MIWSEKFAQRYSAIAKKTAAITDVTFSGRQKAVGYMRRCENAPQLRNFRPLRQYFSKGSILLMLNLAESAHCKLYG